jgi:hypothetical protein
MRKRALEVRDQLERDVSLTEKRLSEDYGGATQDALRELHERALALVEQNKATASQLEKEKQKHEQIRELHDKTQELAGHAGRGGQGCRARQGVSPCPPSTKASTAWQQALDGPTGRPWAMEVPADAMPRR